MSFQPTSWISMDIRSGKRRQGAELTAQDVGRNLGDNFGRVLPIDVGKRVWLKDYGLVMENDAQRDKRKRTIYISELHAHDEDIWRTL